VLARVPVLLVAVEYRQVIRYSGKVNRQAFVSAVVAVADRVLAGEAKGLVARDPADDMVLAAAIGGERTGSSAWTAISSISRRSSVSGSSAPAISSSS
jgi:hypothetical protein